jgi:hypothetical protein
MIDARERPTTRAALERWVVDRAWADPAFGRSLVADPIAALARAGVLPTARQVVVLRETPERLHLVLPPLGIPPEDPTGLVGRLVGRAADDPRWRGALLADPARAIEAETGVRMPTGVRLEVVEEREDVWPIVLPYYPADAPGPELSDLALAAAGGGRTDRPNPVNCVDTLIQVDQRPRRARRGC